MKESTLVISNERGFHARAASRFVHLASGFDSSVKLCRGTVEVDGKSILGILLLQAARGTQLTIRVSGEDEDEAFKQLSEMINGRFGETS
jgi:phosphocarrier protein HPr